MTVTEADVWQKVRDFIVTNFFLDLSEIGLENTTSFLETGIIDSTGIMEVVTYIQDEFDIEIEDREILPENLDTLQYIGQFVSGKLQAS